MNIRRNVVFYAANYRKYEFPSWKLGMDKLKLNIFVETEHFF